MIKSMTGYGKGACRRDGRLFSVEVKAVNNKYGEYSIRMPRIFNPLEERLKRLVAAVAARGRVDVTVHFDPGSSLGAKINYNGGLARAYRGVLAQMADELGLKPSDDGLIALIARFPDIVEIDREIDREHLEVLWQELEEAAGLALEQFTAMRTREGAALASDIKGRIGKITGFVALIEQNAQKVVEHYRERLKKRMTEALGPVQVDEARFLNEVAHFADKAAIDEEIIRLKSHVSQLFEALESSQEAVGRKLDFLAQEMAREANTIGSKANHIDISKIVIDLKGEIEKIREQVQNIE